MSKTTAKALLAALGILTEEEMNEWTEEPGEVKDFLAARVAEKMANTFCVFLSDNELQQQFPQFADRLVPWRKLAALMGYTGHIVWLVKQGFTLKTHAPIVGPCYEKLSYLQGWDFVDDPTDDCLVFWVPRLAKNSTGNNIKAMEKHRAMLKKRYELPEGHAISFGSIQLQFALILAHFKRTGERVPLNCLYMASDTLCADGHRLIAGFFNARGLHCRPWDENGNGNIGFVLLGVEKLGQ